MSTILKALRKVEREHQRRDPQEPPSRPEPPPSAEAKESRRMRRSWQGVAAGLVVGSIAYALMPLMLSEPPSTSATEPAEAPAHSVEEGVAPRSPNPRLRASKARARAPRVAMPASPQPVRRTSPPVLEAAAAIGKHAPAVAQTSAPPQPEPSASANEQLPAGESLPAPPIVEREVAPAPTSSPPRPEPAPPPESTPPPGSEPAPPPGSEPAPPPRPDSVRHDEREERQEDRAPRITEEPSPRESRPIVRDTPAADPSLLVLAPLDFPEVTVLSVRWHPEPVRRSARVELVNAGPLDVTEGDIIAGVMIGEIMPASVELRVGDRSQVVTIRP